MTTIPCLGYARVWLLSIAVTTVLVAGEDAFWRGRGHRPFVDDTADLWTYHRGTAAHNNSGTIVFLGTSRMRAAIDTTALRRNCRYSIVQLAVDGPKSPVGAMAHLIDQGKFRGVIVCEVLAPLMDQSRWGDQRLYYEYRPALVNHFNALSRLLIRSILASRNNRLGWRTILTRVINGVDLPRPHHVESRFDRSVRFDFELVPNLKSVRAIRTEAVRAEYAESDFPTVESLSDELKTLDEMVRRLQQHGGEVVFLRLPSTGERWKIEEHFHPRAKYWAQFREHCSGSWIHFSDLPTIRDVTCPDESHLDQRGASRLTMALIDELRRQHVLAE